MKKFAWLSVFCLILLGDFNDLYGSSPPYPGGILREQRTRSIQRTDNPGIEGVIRGVYAELGATTPLAGTSAGDPCLSDMYSTYSSEDGRSGYYVVENINRFTAPTTKFKASIIGGAGFTSLAGHKEHCEIIKVFLQKEWRGQGLGALVFRDALVAAKTAGYKYAYIETLRAFTAACKLYNSFGFKECKKMGDTGHAPDVCYLMDLSELDEGESSETLEE